MYLMIAVSASLLAASCYTTHGVFSESAYENAKAQVQANMEKNGYNLSGQQHEERNEVVVTGQSYSQYSGYGTKMDNNYHQYETLQFANKAGETAEYSVKYQAVLDDHNNYALQEVQVLGCRTSKAADYSSICTGSASPQNVIGKMAPDLQRSVLNVPATTAAVTCVTVIATLLACLLYL